MANPLARVSSWLYHLGDVGPGRGRAIARTDADLVVTEWASYARREDPYDADDLARMRGGDADRLIVSYISIGEAEPYRYYWRKAWERDPPAWLGETNPEWTDNIKVRYWQPEWQEIIFRYAERIVENGFDGLYLDIVSAYEFWEERRPGARDYRADMADFVAALRERVEAKLAEIDPGRAFVIIAQNAEELVREKGYLGEIDGIAKEDLRFYHEYGDAAGFETLPKSEMTYSLGLLSKAEKAGVETFVVEYIPKGKARGAARALEDEAGRLEDAGIPLYVARGRDLDEIHAQPDFGGEGGGGGGRGAILGGGGPDRLAGTRRADEIKGRGGADELFGRDGDDRLAGGGGRDLLEGGGADDMLFGGGGGDELFGGGGRDRLFGGGGNDWLDGGPGRDLLVGGGAADVFVLSPGRDAVRGFDPDHDEIAVAQPPADAGLAELKQTPRGLLVSGFQGEAMLLLGVTRSEFDWGSVFIDG